VCELDSRINISLESRPFLVLLALPGRNTMESASSSARTEKKKKKKKKKKKVQCTASAWVDVRKQLS
jgi:hypothetical protein